MEHFRTFFLLTSKEKCLFLEALFFLYLAKLMLTLLPFRWCLILLREKKTMDVVPLQDDLMQIKFALGRANLLSFWTNVCLVQSFAARWMLKRRGVHSELYFGIRPGEHKKIAAHAWVASCGIAIINSSDEYQTIFKI